MIFDKRGGSNFVCAGGDCFVSLQGNFIDKHGGSEFFNDQKLNEFIKKPPQLDFCLKFLNISKSSRNMEGVIPSSKLSKISGFTLNLTGKRSFVQYLLSS